MASLLVEFLESRTLLANVSPLSVDDSQSEESRSNDALIDIADPLSGSAAVASLFISGAVSFFSVYYDITVEASQRGPWASHPLVSALRHIAWVAFPIVCTHIADEFFIQQQSFSYANFYRLTESLLEFSIAFGAIFSKGPIAGQLLFMDAVSHLQPSFSDIEALPGFWSFSSFFGLSPATVYSLFYAVPIVPAFLHALYIVNSLATLPADQNQPLPFTTAPGVSLPLYQGLQLSLDSLFILVESFHIISLKNIVSSHWSEVKDHPPLTTTTSSV